MPKNKFDSFYYGIGLKMDEKSIDQMSTQLEGKLNKVVDKISNQVALMSAALKKGTENIDLTALTESLAEAQRELGHFQDFDPGKLQQQITALSGTVEKLGGTIGDVGAQLKTFTDDVTTRLSNIEIKTSKQGKDALKADLKNLISSARLFNDALKVNPDAPTEYIEELVKKVKSGFKSLQDSGNSIEMFADKTIAQYFVTLANIFKDMDAPVEKLRIDLISMADAFRKNSNSDIQEVFKNVGYSIEYLNVYIKKAKANVEEYDKTIAKLESRKRFNGGAITREDDKNLSFDDKIKKIEDYYAQVETLDETDVNYGEKFSEITRHQIALIQAAEKELRELLKSSNGADALAKWQNAFGAVDPKDNKLSSMVLNEYIAQAQEDLNKVIDLRDKTEKAIKQQQEKLGKLLIQEESSKKTKSDRTKTAKQNVKGISAEVEAKLKINQEEWTKTINKALRDINNRGNVTPINIPVNLPKTKTVTSISKQLQGIMKTMDKPLMPAQKKNNLDGNEPDTDAKRVQKKFENFNEALKTARANVEKSLKEWNKALKDAFTFKIELLGLDNKSVTDNIAAHMLPTVEAINMILEDKPLIFHSNIDTLVEEIKAKLQDIKIDIGAGNVNVNPQGLSNVNLILGGIVGTGGGMPQGNPPYTPPATPPTAPSPAEPNSSSITTNGKNVDLQAIYNDAASRIKKMLDDTTDPSEALKKVKQGAQVLYKQLINAEEGTQEYYEAQIQLTVLLSKWRGKIGGKNASEGFKVQGVLGSRGAEANWKKYLVDNGIIPDTKNNRFVSSVSKLEKLYGLKQQSEKSTSTKTPKTRSIQTAEEQMAEQLQAGKQIVEHYIKLAKWAKALGPIAEGADIEIKESDFKDSDTIKRRGNVYTKKDVGTVIKGRKIQFEDLDAFISEYEQSESEEYRQLFGFLKNLIDAYKSNQQRLDSLLDELSDSDVVGRYEFADNKEEILATDIRSAYKTIMSKRGSKNAQQHLSTIFEKYNIDLSELPSAKTYAEQWQIIEQQVIGREDLNFDDLMSELGRLKGNVGKTYENFMTLLKVSRAYMLASNSLGEVGREASILMRGKKERVDKEIREYVPSIGRTRGTGKYIEAGRNQVVTEGIRQELSKLAVVFIDELGNAIAGFGAGKGVVDDKHYLSGASASFSQIIRFLTNALNQAAQIAFDTSKKGTKSYEGVTKWSTPQVATKPVAGDYKFTTVTTAKDKLSAQIEQAKKNKQNIEAEITKETDELAKYIKSEEDLSKVLDLSNTYAEKQKQIKANKDKIAELQSEIDRLISQRDNPGKAYEEIVEQLLKEEQVLIQLQKNRADIKSSGKSTEAIDKQISEQSKKIRSLEENAKYAYIAPTNDNGLKIIEAQQAALDSLNEQLRKETEAMEKQGATEKIEELTRQKSPLVERVKSLRAEIDEITNNFQVQLTEEQSKIVEQKRAEIAKLLQESKTEKSSRKRKDITTRIGILSDEINRIERESKAPSEEQAAAIDAKKNEIDSLAKQISGYDIEIEKLQNESRIHAGPALFLRKEIEMRKKYIEQLKYALQNRARVQSQEDIDRNIAENKAQLDGLLQEQKVLTDELNSVGVELGKIGSPDVLESIKKIVDSLQNLRSRLQRVNEQISDATSKVKSADKKTKLYYKDGKEVSYERAMADLPIAQSNHESAKYDLGKFREGYLTEQISFTTDVITKQKSGEITQEKANELLKLVPKLSELNQKFIDGKLSYQDYIKTVESAYVTMRNATTDEAKASAKADAQRLADAVKLVKKYQDEVAILNEIIKLKKPAEAPKEQTNRKGQSESQSSGRNSTGASGGSQGTSQPSPQLMGGGANGNARNFIPTDASGNIVVNLAETGLAKETTVKAIYDLLSVKKNGDVDSKIEAIKQAISVKEEEERAKAEAARKAQEAESARKRAEEEAARKAAEAEAVRRKAEEDAAKARVEAEEKARKTAEEQARKEAEKKAAEERARKDAEEKVRKEAEKARKEAESRAKEEAQKKAAEAEPEKKKNTEKAFFETAKKTYQETSAGNKVFREQRILSDGEQIIKEFTGLFGSIVAAVPNKFESHGHTHPRDSLYSGTDIRTMAQIRGFNSSYNTDWLATPSYIYKLTGLANVPPAKLEHLAQIFEGFERSGMNSVLARKAKESELYHFAQDNGLNYSKNTYDELGNLTNVLGDEAFISKEALAIIKEFINVCNELQTATGDKKQTLSDTREKLRDKLKQDAVVGPLMLSDNQEKDDERMRRRATSQKMRSSTLIQEAIDYDFDFSLFVNQFKDFFDALDKLGENIDPNSSLAQIKKHIQDLGDLDTSSAQSQDIIKKIQTLSKDVFGRSNSPHMDVRYLSELKEIALRDKSGKINRTIRQVKADGLLQSVTNQDDAPDEYKDKSIAELKAELTRLEKLRDNGEVDPRFATAENQKIIIELLKNGIKVTGNVGKKESSGSTGGKKQAKPKVVKMPTTAKADELIRQVSGVKDLNKESTVYKQYESTKSQYDNAVSSAIAKGDKLTKDEADRVRALANEVTRLARQIVKASTTLDDFKQRGSDAFKFVTNDVDILRDEMTKMAYQNATDSQMLLSDIAYDEATQKMSYSLTDLEGNVTKVRLAYNDLFGVILKTSDKSVDSAAKTYNAIEKELRNRIGINNITDTYGALAETKQYQQYIEAYDKMIAAKDDVAAKGEMATKEERKNLLALVDVTEKARGKFEALAKSTEQFYSKVDKASVDDVSTELGSQSMSDVMKDYVLHSQEWKKSQQQMIIDTWSFNDAEQQATYAVVDHNNQLRQMVVVYDDGTRQIGQYVSETKKYTSGLDKFMNSLKGKWQEVLRYFMTFGSIYRVFGELRKGVQYVQEIDLALTELKKVTDETEETYERFLNTAAKTADKVGSTIKEVVSSTADWARLGYSLEDAANLAESTSVLLNVSEFQSIDDATSALVSTMQAFGYAAKDSMHVVDVMNEIGNNYAVSSDGIATALQDSASSLMAANNSYQEAVALIASANKVVQDPNSVGSALRTISLRLRGTSTKELGEAGEDTEGVITSKSKLRNKIKTLSGVDILTDTGAYKSTYEILLEISKVWKDMSDIDQAALLEIIAGKTRSNTAAAILSNTTDLENAYVDALNAEGSALEENEKYLNSIQGRIDLFNNAVQTMWSNALNDEVIKVFVNIGTQLVKWVDSLGLIKTLLIAIGTYVIQKNFKGDLFGGLFGDNTKSIDQIKSTLESLKKAKDDAAKILAEDPNNKFKQKKFQKAETAYTAYNDSVGSEIETYNNLIEKQKVAQENLNKAQHEFIKATREDVDPTTLEAYGNSVKNAKVELENVDLELEKIKVQTNAVGNSGMTAGQKIKAGFKSALPGIKRFGAEVAKSLAWSMAIAAVFETIYNIGGWLKAGWDVIKPKSAEDLQESLEKTESELSSVKSELRSLESELDDTNDRIEELMNQGSLTFIEQEELSKLKSATAELKAQIALKETLQKSLQTAANGQSISATDAYLDTSFMSDQTKTERQEAFGETGEEIGKAVGVVGGALSGGLIVKLGVAIGTAITPGLGTAIGIAIGSLIGGLVGKFAGEGIAGASYDSEQTVGEAMDEMIATRASLKQKQDEALAKQDAKAYNEATEALTTYDNQMAKHISQIQANYNAMDWETATDEQKKTMIEYADWLSKYSISMGTEGAKSAAIERIFGEEADSEIKDIKKSIEDAMKSGKDFDFAEAFNRDSEAVTKFKDRLYDMGLTVADLKYYFLDLKQAEEEEKFSAYDTAVAVGNLSDAVESLTNAFSEFNEKGLVTGKTLASLNEIFSSAGDAWLNYINIMASGTASTKEAQKVTEELLQEWANNKIMSEPFDLRTMEGIQEYLTTINQLQALGVTNAKEYVDNLQKSVMINSIAKSVVSTSLENDKTLARKKKERDEGKISVGAFDSWYAQNYKSDKALMADALSEYEKIYGIILSDKEKELVLEQAITAEKDKQAAEAAKAQVSETEAADRALEIAEDAYNAAEVAAGGWTENKAVVRNRHKIRDVTYTKGDKTISKEEYNSLQAAKTAAEEALQKAKEAREALGEGMTAEELATLEKAAEESAQAFKDKCEELGIAVDVDLEFINASQSVDDIQSIFDTLKDAQKEYNEEGYFSVDTLQSLLELEPKYLALLIDENGNLNLNEQTLYDVAIARITDMKLKQQDAILSEAEQLATAGTIDALYQQIDATYGMSDAYDVLIERRLNNIRAILEERKALADGEEGKLDSSFDVNGYISSIRHQLTAVESAATSSINNIKNSLSSSGNTAKAEAEDAFQKAMDYWENRIAANQAKYEQIQNEIDLLEKQGKMAGEEYYQEQIKLENERLSLLEQQKAEAKKFLGTFKEGSDEWFRTKPA